MTRPTYTKAPPRLPAVEFETYEYHIGAHLLSALINADPSGLSDEEESELTAWEQQARQVPGGDRGHFEVPDDETDFRTCDVTGAGSDTRLVRFHAPKG